MLLPFIPPPWSGGLGNVLESFHFTPRSLTHFPVHPCHIRFGISVALASVRPQFRQLSQAPAFLLLSPTVQLLAISPQATCAEQTRARPGHPEGATHRSTAAPFPFVSLCARTRAPDAATPSPIAQQPRLHNHLTLLTQPDLVCFPYSTTTHLPLSHTYCGRSPPQSPARPRVSHSVCQARPRAATCDSVASFLDFFSAHIAQSHLHRL